MKRILGSLFICLCLAGTSAQVKTLTLDECVQIAIENNPQLMQTGFMLKIAGRDMLSSVSRFLPSASADVGYSHSVVGPSSKLRIDSRTGIPVPMQPDEIVSFTSRASMSVSQQIFNGSDIFGLWRATSLKKGAQYDFERTKQDVIYRVKERYYNLLKAQKLLEVQEETIKSSEESHKRAEVSFEVGKVPKSDVLKAKVLLEQSRLGLIEAQNTLSVARASLNHVLGFDVDTEIQIVDNIDMPEQEVDYQNAFDSGMTLNPGLRKGIMDVKAAKASIGSAASQFLPTVSAYGGYTWRNERFNRIKNMFDKDYNWNAGVSLSVPLFTGFTRLIDVSKAQLGYRADQEALEQTRKDVALEVKQSYFAVEQAKKKISVTQDAEAAADEDLRLNKEKYNLGSSTILDLINAQVSYTQARSDRIQALYDYKINMARLLRAMGKLEK